MTKMKGKVRSVWLSEDLDRKVEIVRKKFYLSRSSFLRYAIVEMVDQFEEK